MQEERDQFQFILGILRTCNEDQLETTKHLLQHIQNHGTDSLNMLRGLNQLMNSKALPSHQRRDMAAITRLVAESRILGTLQKHIRVQAETHTICRVDGFYLQTIKLIGGLCWENPHFIDNIVESCPQILELLFSLLADSDTLPNHHHAIIYIINFMHSISLKEGPVRDKQIGEVFTTFIQHIFTHDKFYDCLDQKKLNSLFTAILKFHSNVKKIDRYLYNALIRSIRHVNQIYKEIEEKYSDILAPTPSHPNPNDPNNNPNLQFLPTAIRVVQAKKAIRYNDRKLVALLKIEEKSRAGLFQKIDPFRFVLYLKIIAKIAIDRRLVLVQTAFDNKILISSISETIKFIRDWKLHLSHTFADKPQQLDPNQHLQHSKPEHDLSEMVDESLGGKVVSLRQITDDYFINSKDQRLQFEEISNKIRNFSESYYRIVMQSIDAIMVAYRALQNKTGDNYDENYNLFRVLYLGSRLDRVLSIMMKLMDENQLMKKDYYKNIVANLFDVFRIFAQVGHLSQIKTVHSVLIDLKSMTVESDISKTRFILQKIDEDQFKSNLQVKLTAAHNSENLISDTILKFSLYLSEYEDYLHHISSSFLTKVLNYYYRNHLKPMEQKEQYTLQDIELLRSIVRILSEMFPSNHKCNKDDLLKVKLYYASMLYTQEPNQTNIFWFAAVIVNILNRFDCSKSEDLEDSLENREEMAKNIFYKLITHRLKLFFTTITTFYEQLRRTPTPAYYHPPRGLIELPRSLMFEGNRAYVECMQQPLKLLLLDNRVRENSLNEQIVGLLLMKLYQFRTFDLFQYEAPQVIESQRQFRQIQINLYNQFIEKKCSNMFQWLIQNLGFTVYKLPMLVKKLLHFRREEYVFDHWEKRDIVAQMKYVSQCFCQVVKVNTQSFYKIEGKFLDIGIRMITKKMRKEIQLVGEIDLKREVVKLANTCVTLSEFMIEYKATGMVEKKPDTFPENYIISIIGFSAVCLNRFAAELHFPEEANYLIRSTLWLIENYLSYKNILIEEKKKKKLLKRQQHKLNKQNQQNKPEKLITNKQTIKRTKTNKKYPQQKNIKILDNNDSNLDSNLSRPKRKAPKKQKPKETATNAHLLNEQRLKEDQKVKKAFKKRNIWHFKLTVQHYLRTVLTTSNKGEKPYLKNITFQYLFRFISSNLKKNTLSKPPCKYFQLKMADYISDLLKVEVAEKKVIGYHLLLARTSVKLITEEHLRIEYQTGVKRYFYDRSGQRIAYMDFISFLETNFINSPNLAHLVEIVMEGQETLDFGYQNIHPMEKNGQKNKLIESQVRIKENVEFSHITLNKKSEKKEDKKKQQEKKEDEKKEKTIKLSDYVPEGQISIFVQEMINHAIDSIIHEIDKSMEHYNKQTLDMKLQEYPVIPENSHAFTSKNIIHTLQFLIRDSPTMAPWIAKFKCKKMILNCLKSQKLVNKQTLTKYIFGLLNNYEENSQTIAEIGFLQVLLRLFSPFLLNSVSGIIFQLCLDSTPLVHNLKNNNENEEQKLKFVSFGSVVRQKVVAELDSILFGGNPIEHVLRKAAAMNTISVLLNIREMAKLLIQCNFISKIYSQYLKIVKEYGKEMGNQVFLMPGLYLSKIFIPFFLQPLSIMQELNIAFHHNKKLIKAQQKYCLNALSLTEQLVNAQLIPSQVFKKNKFKQDWPFARQHPKKELNRYHERFAMNESDEDSDLENPDEEDSFDDQSEQEDDDEESSVSSELLEERMAEIDRMNQEEEYVSLQSGNNEHLLNDEWDYSNSGDLDLNHRDRMLEDRLQMEYIEHELGRRQEEHQDIDYLSEGEMQQLQEEDLEDDQHGEGSYSDSIGHDGDDFSFISVEGELPLGENGNSLRDQLLFKHKEEEEFYDNTTNIIAFERINVVPRISKIEVTQVIYLRFFLQVFSLNERELQNAQSMRHKNASQIYEEKKVKESQPLLQAFLKDKELPLAHKVEWNQVYRYDNFVKKHPLSEATLNKLFADDHEVGVGNRVRRRNGVIHRNGGRDGMIQVFRNALNGDYDEELEQRVAALEEQDQEDRHSSQSAISISSNSNSNSSSMSNSQSPSHHSQPMDPQQLQPLDMEIEVDDISDIRSRQRRGQSHSSSEVMEEQQRLMPQDSVELIARLNRQYPYGRENLNRILREMNMNMNFRQFYQLEAELQNDIMQTYYMNRAERAHNNVPIDQDSPIRILPQTLPLLPLLQPLRPVPIVVGPRPNQHRARDRSPRIRGQQPPVQLSSSSSDSMMGEVGEGMQEQYRKMSMEHTMKLNKDIIQTLNKNGKNNNKFYEIGDEELFRIICLFCELNNKEYKNYPYSLIETACLNTNNLLKIISSLIAILNLLTKDIVQLQNSAEIKLEYLEDKFQRFFLQMRFELEKEETDPLQPKQPKLMVKIVYLLSHLTKNYSIAMSFLRINATVPWQLHGCVQQRQETKSSLQMLILFLQRKSIFKEEKLLEYLITVIENITIHHFYKSINALVHTNLEDSFSENSQQTVNSPILISQQAAQLLCDLLQNTHAKDHLHHLSRIIMRLSINDSNLTHFIRFMYEIVEGLCTLCLSEMDAASESQSWLKVFTAEKGYLKIVNLMNIFFEMVVSFKSYPTPPQKHEAVLTDLRKIVQFPILQEICQKAASSLFSSSDPNLQTMMGEILEIYFILYEIALATSDLSQLPQPEDLSHKHIAGLGHIQELRKLQKSSELKKEVELLLGKFNLSKLWKESISQGVFKTYINNCIKKKLASFGQNSSPNQSIFDVPIFKVAISTPHMLSFDNKRLIFKTELKKLRKKAKYHMIHMSLRREEVFEDSFTEIMHYQGEMLKGKIKIEFKDEEGEDAGGITREWFQLLSKKMFDPNFALFKSGSTGNTFHPSPQSYINSLHLKYFKFIGRIIGKALYDGYLLDAYFTPAFYKHILNLPITYLDMEEEDYDYFKSLKWILDNSPIQDFLELNFTYSFDNFGQIQAKELIPGGEQIIVTDDNKLEYVQLSSYAKMATSIKHQLEALLEGFHELIPHKLIRIFNEKELEIMISGRPTIDIEDLRRNTELINYMKNDQIITWLFEVLESFNMELRTAFLQFVTGSSRVPVEGFKDLRGVNGVQKFNIHKEFQEDRLPRAHTCFNQLDLPNYKTKELLIEKLMLAITEGKDGFHML